MRTTEARPGSRGFTLLELMVVLVLIGVLTGAAVLGLRTADPVERAGRFAQQLQAQLALLHEQAEQSATARALRIDPAHYRPYAEDGRGGWQALDVQRWPPLELPGDCTLQLGSADTPDPAQPGAPQLFWWPDGEASPFTLDILHRGVPVYRLRGDGLGRLQAAPLAPPA